VSGQPAQVWPPPKAKERLAALIKARADVIQKPLFNEQGEIVQPGIDKIDDAMRESLTHLGNYLELDGSADKVRSYLSGGDMPENWIPKGPVDLRKAGLEGAAAAGRAKHPVQSAVYDYALGPLAEIAPAAGQVFADTYAGIANLAGANIKPWDIKAGSNAVFGQIVDATVSNMSLGRNEPLPPEQRDVLDKSGGGVSEVAHGAGEFVGMATGMMAGGGAGAAGKAVTTGAKALQAGKAAVMAPTTVMRAGGNLGAKAGKALFGKGAGEAFGRGAGSFAAYEGVAGKGEGGEAPTLLERGKNAAWGAVAGAWIHGAGEVAKAAYKGILQSSYKSLGPTEKEAVEALKTWASENKVFPVARETHKQYEKRLRIAYVEAGMPGAPPVSIRKMLAYAAQGGIEGTGFSLLDQQFREDLIDAAWHGKTEKFRDLGIRYLANSFGSAALHMPLEDIPKWQRRQSKKPEPTGQEPQNKPQPEPPLEREVERMEGEGGPDPELARMGWERETQEPSARPEPAPLSEQDAAALAAQGKGPEQAPPEAEVYKIKGTPYRYKVEGGMAKPSPKLRELLKLEAEVPIADINSALERMGLVSAMASKRLLPGPAVNAHGGGEWHAETGKGDAPPVVRRIVGEEVQEAPLTADPNWKPAEQLQARGKDVIDPPQQEVVEALTEVLGRPDLSQPDRVVLAEVIQTLDSVSLKNDAAVAETMGHIQFLMKSLTSGSPEQASGAIKALAESLTTKHPNVAIGDMAKSEAFKPPEAQEPAREGERGSVISPKEAKEGLVQAADAVGRSKLNPKRFYRPQTKELRKSGPVGEDIARRAVEVNDLQRQRLGKVGKLVEGTLAEAIGTGRKGRPHVEAKEWAEDVTYDAQGRGEANFKQVAEGTVEGAPEAVQRWAQTYAETRRMTGEFAKEARTVRAKKVDRKDPNSKPGYELFEPLPTEAKVFVRQTHSEFFKMVERGGPKLQEFAEALGGYKRNRIDPKKLIDEWQPQVEKIESREAFEFRRDMPDIFSHFKFKDGSTVQVLETSPYEVIKDIAQRGATRSSVVQHVGQENVPNDIRAQFGQAPGPDTLLNALHKEGGRVDVAKTLIQNLNAMGADALPQWLPKEVRKLETLRRVAQILKSAPLDLVEGLSTIPQFTGFRDALTGMAKGGMNYKEIKDYLERIGSLTIEAGHHLMVEDTGLVGALTQKIGLPKQLSADIGSVMAGASALNVLKRFENGDARMRDTIALERMEFTGPEIATLTSGTSEQPLKDRFVRRFVSNATGQFLRGERSQWGASQTVNLLFPYNRYFMNRFRQFVETTSQLGTEVRRFAKDKTPENRARAAAATGQWLRFMLGATVAGSIGTYLSYLMVDGGIDAYKQLMSEAVTDPVAFAGRAAKSSWLGGLPGAAAGVATDTHLPLGERLERLSPQIPLASLGVEALMASSGSGQYKGENIGEKLVTLSGRLVPALRDLDFLAGWAGFDVNPDMEGKLSALSRWKRITGKQSSRGVDTIEEENLTRWRAMRDLAGTITAKAGDGELDLKSNKEVRAAVKAALGEVSGKSMAASLRGRKVLTDLDADELNDLAEREGEDVLRALQAHDDALEAVADTYAKVPKDLAAAEQMDLDQLLDVASRNARIGEPKGFRDAVRAIEDVVDARRAAKLPIPKDEIARLASVMADFPEVSRELFSEEQQKHLARIKSPNLLKARINRLLRERLTSGKAPPTIEKIEAKK
jgi:hypothetical protein